MKRTLIGLLVLMVAGVVFASDTIIMKSGETAPSFKVRMVTSAGTPVTGLVGTNFTLYYTEHLLTQQTVNCTAITNANDAYDDNGAVEIGQGWYRFDLPAVSVDGAAGTYVDVTVTDETLVARDADVKILLNPYVNADLVGGTTALTATEIAAASWNALWTSYTTENSFGRLVRQIFNKVMSLR
jgi:hypothetical protein